MIDKTNTIRLTQACTSLFPGRDFFSFKLYTDKPVAEGSQIAKNPKIGQRLLVIYCQKTEQNDYELTCKLVTNDPAEFFNGALELNKTFTVIE